MGEIQIIEGYPKDVQKLLNQWRHQFHLVIHGQTVFMNNKNETWCVLTVERNQKEGK